MISHQRALWINFCDHSRLFHQSLKNWPIVERLFCQLMTHFISGHFNCHCRAVQERVNVWTVRQDKKVVIVQRFPLVWLYNILHKGSKNQNGCQTVTIKFLVMHTTFQGFKLIPGHQGERKKIKWSVGNISRGMKTFNGDYSWVLVGCL